MDDILDRLITFLRKFQSSDGSFLSYSSSTENFDSPEFTYSTICTTAFVLNALDTVKELAGVRDIQKKAAEFLLKNKSDYETWNYWDRESPEYTNLPYPDDTDDTFAALSALYTYDANLVNGKALAQIVKGLTALEREEGGPYYTWYTKSKKAVWKDVDAVANAQIASFLKMQGVELPNLTRYFMKLVKEKTLHSLYYPSPLHCIYFMSRLYTDDALRHLINKHLVKNANPLEMALAASSLKRLTIDETGLIDNLLSQKYETYTTAYPFCIDPMRHGKKYFSGSPALTAAAIIEAFSLSQKKSPTIDSEQFKKTHTRVLNLSDSFPVHLKSSFEKQVKESIDTKAGKQCILAPVAIASAFNTKVSDDICFAQACGWIAYEIFDDCVDEKKVNNLGIAIMLYGEMIRIFSDIFSNDSEYNRDFLERLKNMNSSLLEEAAHINKKERTTHHQKSDWMLHKSSGYMLGPLAVMHALGYPRQSKTTQAIVAYFENLILALQLSDDAHDWQDDMQNFRRNSVVEMLPKLATLRKTECEKYFWESGVEIVLEKIQEHCITARKAYQSVIFTKILDEPIKLIEDMCSKTLRERNTAKEFLQEY
jgi:hypothetical protein